MRRGNPLTCRVSFPKRHKQPLSPPGPAQRGVDGASTADTIGTSGPGTRRIAAARTSGSKLISSVPVALPIQSRMTSFDNVLRAFKATRPPHDDLLSKIASQADIDDTVIPLPITLALIDGTVVSGTVGSDLSMAEAFDKPLRARLEEARARPGLSAEGQKALDEALPSLAGRSLHHWLQGMYDRALEASQRAGNDGKPLEWTELSEPDVMILATFAERSAITIRNATIERDGAKKPRHVPIMRVQFSAVTSWWVTDGQ
jgi:hypothetical protein